jgi:general secretion pathway protein I
VTIRRGFTLIEVLVALTILAIALAAGMRALAQSADGATTLKLRTLALWVAQNRLAIAELERPWPATGARSGAAREAGVTFTWREAVAPTPNPAFRRIEIVVAQAAQPDYALAHLVGYLGVTGPDRDAFDTAARAQP